MQAPARRVFLVQAGALALGGCGFQLRGAPELAFSSLFINVADTSSMGNELKRNLGSLGTLQIVSDATQVATAQAVLDILAEQREKTVVGVNATGQVREFQLRVRIRFRLRTPQGKELIPDTELLQQRDISFNESAVLAKEAEESLMYRDMQSDIVQQLMRRLAAVRTL
jgi:LPS-assembly lipoprotein